MVSLMPNRFRQMLASVYTRLILITLVTWMLIILVVIGFVIAHRSASDRPFHANVIQYFNYVIDDLGAPPDRARADALSRQTGLNIAFRGGSGAWSFIDDLPGEDRIRYRPFSNSAFMDFGRYRGRHFFKVTHATGIFWFEVSPWGERESRFLWLISIFLILLTLILAGAFLGARQVLKPIKRLHQGVNEVGRGNLMHIVPDDGKDEFGQLAASFNTMTGRLNRMMALKQRLLRDVSHELRSPLTRAKVALEFVDDESVKKSISADLCEMEAMIATILENARLHHDHSRLEKKRSDLVAWVRQTAALFKHRAPKVTWTDHPPILCEFDPEQIRTVVTNVIENAIKYSHAGSDPVEIRFELKKRWAMVVITDTGVGMDPAKAPLVLEPFYRLDPSRSKETGGYGLGLSLCKTIMDAHSGNIRIDSSPGRGTSVSLFLPLS